MLEPIESLMLPSLDTLWAHLRAHPHLTYTMRHWCDGKLVVQRGKASFAKFDRGLIKFVNWKGEPILLSLRNGVGEHEWGVRFFRGGFRFRRHRLSFTFRFVSQRS